MIPMPGQIYRHFKGGEYMVIRVLVALDFELKDEESYQHTVNHCPIKFRCCCNVSFGETVIIYQGSDTRVWARSLTNFKEALPSEDGGDSGKRRRFELIEESE